MEEVDDKSPEQEDVVLKPTLRIPMHFNQFLQNRELFSNKRVIQTYNADFEKSHFCQKDIREHTGCINAVQFSHREQLLATGGDDMQCRVWIVDELMLRKNPKPRTKVNESHVSNIFSLEFDLEDRFLYSGERRGYIIKHDIETGQPVYTTESQRQRGEVYHLDHHPFDTNAVVVTHAHSITMLDDRDRGNQTSFLTNDFRRKEFYSAEFHPISPVLLLINSEYGGPNIYDRRNPRGPIFERIVFNGLPSGEQAWMGSGWSPSGNQFMAIRRSHCPLYFDLVTKRCFELKSADSPIGYQNTKTIKSMTFIDDYTVATGSDHWGIHVWKCPRADDTCGFVQIDDEHLNDTSQLYVEKELRILRGHRSIPNQVRFSKENQLFVSSGVENSFKLWSHCRLPWSYDTPFERRKVGNYPHSAEVELLREKEERRILEDALDIAGEMEGRSCWNDVFGGDPQTGENRETLEMFDTLDGDDGDDDDHSDDDNDFFPFPNNIVNAHRNRDVFFLNRLREGPAGRILRLVEGDQELLNMFLNRRRFLDDIMNSDEEGDNEDEEGQDEPIEVHDESDAESDNSDDSDDDPLHARRELVRFLDEEPYDDEEDDEEEEGVEEIEVDENDSVFDDEQSDEEENQDNDAELDLSDNNEDESAVMEEDRVNEESDVE